MRTGDNVLAVVTITDLFIQLCDKSGDNFENKIAGYVLYNTNLVKI